MGKAVQPLISVLGLDSTGKARKYLQSLATLHSVCVCVCVCVCFRTKNVHPCLRATHTHMRQFLLLALC